MFFCHEHHVETDDELKYTAEKLKQFKADHEARFREKPFHIQIGYIKQVLANFEELKQGVSENLEITKAIANDQRALIEMLQRPVVADDTQEIITPQFAKPNNSTFVGRERELENFRTGVERYTTVQIGGISGVGKTSFLAEALQDNTSTIWIDCAVMEKNS